MWKFDFTVQQKLKGQTLFLNIFLSRLTYFSEENAKFSTIWFLVGGIFQTASNFHQDAKVSLSSDSSSTEDNILFTHSSYHKICRHTELHHDWKPEPSDEIRRLPVQTPRPAVQLREPKGSTEV